MSEQRNDTSEHEDAPPVADDQQSKRSYYYDDATNYEIYDPAKDNDEEEDAPESSATKQLSVFNHRLPALNFY